jgi:superfamily II DNA or RNA helicase
MVQYAGRLHRQRENKKEIRIYDYVDSKMSLFEKMYKRRLKAYKSLGYEKLK